MTRRLAEWYRLDGNIWVLEDDRRECTLAGIDCQTCGNVWGIPGCAYPTVPCAGLPEALRSDEGPTSPERYEQYLAEVVRKLGNERPLMPGTDFGPRTAPLRREPPHYFLDASSLILREDVALDPAIEELGLRMARFEAVTRRSKKSFTLFEVEAWPLARRPERIIRERMRGVAPACAVCGFRRWPSYEGEPLLASTLAGQHMVGLDQAPGTHFVSAAFKDALSRHRTTPSVSFVPVEVVSR